MQPIVIGGTTYDYSQPLATTVDYHTLAAAQDAPADQLTPADLAADAFDAAREAFFQGDYAAAMSRVNEAIAQTPDDVTLHEFRALVWFATGQFKEAAAAIYAVLSAGPGWDWTTLSSLYSNIDVYTAQLRALEAYVGQNPNEPQSRFLLAYHYLTIGQTDAAAGQLKEVVRLSPNDTLAAQLLAGLVPPAEQTAPAPTPSTAAAPVTAAALTGNWKAQQPDGTAIALKLNPDSSFSWQVSKGERQQEFGGKFSVADNLLILNENDNPAMVGQVTESSAKSFNFRLPGAPPSDPGLTFTR